MAKAQSRADKDSNIATLPNQEPESSQPEETPQESTPPTQPSPAAGKPKGGKTLTFFQQVDRIDPADWGTRAYILLYRLEPIIDRLRSTENKYIAKYGEAIDQERIKQDHGSGRYRLYLTFKVPAAKESREVDSTEFDINDPAYPPNLPLGEWVEDSKNKKWAWAKAILEKREAEKKLQSDPQSAGMESMVKVLDLVDRIEQRAAKRVEPVPAAATQPDGTAQLTALVNAAEKIANLKQPTPTPPTSSTDALREDMKYYRERTDKLTDKLMEALAAKSTAPSGFDTFKGVVKEIADFLPQVKSLLPTPGEGDSVSRMTGSQEFWQGIINTSIEKVSPLLTLVGNFMMTRAMQQAAAQPRTPPPPGSVQLPTALPQAPQFPATQPGTPPTPPVEQQQPLTPIVEQVPATPTMEQMTGMFQVIGQSVAAALLEGKDGSVYAENFEGLFGEVAYDQLAALPKERLLQMFQSMPMWNQLGILQQKVPQFIEEFIDYGKPEAPGTPSADEGDEA